LIKKTKRLQKGKSPDDGTLSLCERYKSPGLILDVVHAYIKVKGDREATNNAVQMINRYKSILYSYDPKKTWKASHILVRGLFEFSDFKSAAELVAGHQKLDGEDWVDAVWLDGWLQGKVFKNFARSVQCFSDMYEKSKTPISKAKAAYWLAEVTQQKDWLQKASEYPTTFYGQEAILRMGKAIEIPDDPRPTQKDIKSFNQNELVQAAKLFIGSKAVQIMKPLLYVAIKRTNSKGEHILMLEMASKHIPHEMVALAKIAAQQHEIYGHYSYPQLPKKLHKFINGVDVALAHAVIRKESEFNPRAISPAGALGLMQVMPDTGRHLSKKIGVKFSEKSLLNDPVLNIKLGCAYLMNSSERYAGCPILTLASYNAGPKPTNDWVEIFGDPRSEGTSKIAWIEKIPFGETRNYAHRVIEAMRVYSYKIKRGDKSSLVRKG
jgi:soluble lytic murein transglycosylase